MEIINKYTKELIEENLPDYLFGKLSESERRDFESALIYFPELAKLAENLRDSYSSVKNENFDRIANKQTADIPSKVISRLRLNKPNRAWQNVSRSLFYALPVAAVILIAYFILPPSFWNKDITTTDKSKIVAFNDDDLNGLDDEYPLGLNSENTNKHNGFTKEEYDILDEFTENYYASIIEDESEKNLKKQIEPAYNYDKSENSYAEIENEQELENILQEIENVNFKTNN